MSDTPVPASSWSRKLVGAAAAALLVAGAGTAAAVALHDDDSPAAEPTRTALQLPASGVMGSCIRFSTDVLKDMSPAFAATVTAVDGSSATLAVTKTYAGEVGDEVVVSQPAGGTTAELDGVRFEKGQDYLLTAAQGTINGCGYSGAATPELQQAFDEAFPR